jgi:hypothetical protein
MAMRGWSRRSRRDTPAVTDAAFASMLLLASALRRAEAPPASHEMLRSKHADENCPACSASCKVAE